MFNTTKLLLLICLLAGIAGCKKENTDSTSNVNAKEVEQKANAAMETAGTYLNQQKDAIMEKANQSFSQMKTDTEQAIKDLNASGQQAWQDMATDLNSKLQAAQEKLYDLKNSDNVQKAKDAFDTAITELKQAYEKAKAQLQDKTNQATPN